MTKLQVLHLFLFLRRFFLCLFIIWSFSSLVIEQHKMGLFLLQCGHTFNNQNDSYIYIPQFFYFTHVVNFLYPSLSEPVPLWKLCFNIFFLKWTKTENLNVIWLLQNTGNTIFLNLVSQFPSFHQYFSHQFTLFSVSTQWEN